MDAKRSKAYQKKYGITEEDFQRMLAKQGGVCAICGCHQRYQRLAVDHCHRSGVVRGLLCVNCNRGLGKFFDSPLRLIRAAEYLKNAKAEGTQTREGATSTRRPDIQASQTQGRQLRDVHDLLRLRTHASGTISGEEALHIGKSMASGRHD